jgi:tetratricopeptide (TPR) repeat protein
VTGPLAEGVVPQLLREIYVGRRHGWLHLSRAEERQSLRFRRGHIVNARTNVVQERMGEVMVRHGLLSEADLARATEIVIRDKKRLGEVLTDLGLVDASRLEDAVALHVHELLAKVFAWTDGSYTFEREEETPGGDVTLKLSTGELILEAVQAVKDPEAVRGALGDLDRVPALSSDPLLRFQKLTLSPTDGFVLSRVDGLTSAREIVQMISLPPEEVEKSLFGLLSTGVIEYSESVRRKRGAGADAERPAEAPPDAPAAPPEARSTAAEAPAATSEPTTPAHLELPPLTLGPAEVPPAAPAATADAASTAAPAAESDRTTEQRREIEEAWGALKGRNHFEVLGLARNVGEAEVKEAYFRLAKRFHPDVHHGSSLSDLHDKLEAVFIRLGEAYDVLRDPRRRAQYEERLGRSRGPTTPPAGVPAAAAETAGAASAAPAGGVPRDAEEDSRIAEDAIRRALKLFEKAEQGEKGEGGEGRSSEYWDAIQLLEPVVGKAQGKLRTKGEVLLGRCYLKNPKWSRRAEELLLAVTRRDAGATEAWALLGGIYAEKAMHNRALSMYRKALELRPEHEEAARYIATHGTADEPAARPPEGGILRRLFRRS